MSKVKTYGLLYIRDHWEVKEALTELDVLLMPWQPVTRSNCKRYIKKWKQLFSRCGIDSHRPIVNNVLEFLIIFLKGNLDIVRAIQPSQHVLRPWPSITCQWQNIFSVQVPLSHLQHSSIFTKIQSRMVSPWWWNQIFSISTRHHYLFKVSYPRI